MAILHRLLRTGGKREKNLIYSPLAGKLVPLEKVSDPVFAERTLGDGIAVIPENGEVYAPADGVIQALFPTGHALAIQTDDGTEILIHIGIDTVTMKGEGFRPLVGQEQRVRKGELLIRFEPDKITQAGLETTTMVLVTNGAQLGQMRLTESEAVTVGERLLWF